jgi:hypothetical protein
MQLFFNEYIFAEEVRELQREGYNIEAMQYSENIEIIELLMVCVVTLICPLGTNAHPLTGQCQRTVTGTLPNS